MSESRAQLLWRHVYRFIFNGPSWATYAATVRDIHETATPDGGRTVEWSQHRDAHTRMRNDAQTLRRFEHDTKFGLPMELEEPMVLALRRLRYAKYDDLMADLAARYGLIASRLPADGEAVANVGNLSIQFGEALEAMAPILADGIVDMGDVLHAQRAARELTEVIAAANTLVKRFNDLIQQEAIHGFPH
jgi:hypothetical protein